MGKCSGFQVVSRESLARLKRQGNSTTLNDGMRFSGCFGAIKISNDFNFDVTGSAAEHKLISRDGNFSHTLKDGEEINIIKVSYPIPDKSTDMNQCCDLEETHQ